MKSEDDFYQKMKQYAYTDAEIKEMIEVIKKPKKEGGDSHAVA